MAATATGILLLTMASCAANKPLGDGEYRLHKVSVKTDDKIIDVSKLQPYIKQQPNGGLFRSSNVVYDTLLMRRTCSDMQNAMQNMGFLDASVEAETAVKGRKIDVDYLLHPGEPYFIRHIDYDIQDKRIADILSPLTTHHSLLKEGMRFSVDQLDNERKRLTKALNDQGFYKFHKNYISFTVDSMHGSRLLDVNPPRMW